ncbi:unnamed protein product [Leuciscus chuanchicus]
MADSKEVEIQNAARRLVNLLRDTLNAGPSNVNFEGSVSVSQNDEMQAQRGSQSGPGTLGAGKAQRVQQNMARAFPGLFKSKVAGKLARKRGRKSTPVQFFLLDKNRDRTPKANEDAILLQAGLGRRTISVPEEADHSESSGRWKFLPMATSQSCLIAISETGKRWNLNAARTLTREEVTTEWVKCVCTIVLISALFCEVFPKLAALDGAWMLYKAAAKEFERMPKAKCITCQVYVPVQLLALHIDTCGLNSPSECKIISDDESSLESIIDDADDFDNQNASSNEPPSASTSVVSVKASSNEPPSASTSVVSVKVACPVCLDWYPKDYVELHASSCGESLLGEFEKELDWEDKLGSEKTREEKPCRSLSDIITLLAERVDSTSAFNISVTRGELFERGMVQWKRQKKSSPKNTLCINFLGEYGIDNGALRKEFLTEMMKGIEAQLFEGGDSGKNPKYSITDYQKDHFKTCGEIFAVSVAQGGPPPNFLKKWCYDYICTGAIDKDDMSKDNVTDPELIELIEKVDAADTDAMINLSDRILTSGYTGAIGPERKKAIIDAIVLHSAVRIIPMLQQVCDGLKLYGFQDLLVQHSETCLQFFVPGHLKKVDAEFLELALAPIFSEEGSLRRHRECRIINFLQDFIQKLEDDEELATAEKEEGVGNISQNSTIVSSFFQWLTGQAHIPLIAAQREAFKIRIEFDHDCDVRYGHHSTCYPVVNACAVCITFPTKHLGTYQEFQDILSEAINNSQEFGRH